MSYAQKTYVDYSQIRHRRVYGSGLPEEKLSLWRPFVLRWDPQIYVESPIVTRCTAHWTRRGLALSSKCQFEPPIWGKSFSTLERVTKANVLHRDISFQNMRVNENDEPILWDFDMATKTGDKATGVRERTSTVQFMVRKVLDGQPHQAFHDCESVYWLCSLSLLLEHATSVFKACVGGIASPATTLENISCAKKAFISKLLNRSMLEGDRRERNIMAVARLNSTAETELFECLIVLLDYFNEKTMASPKETANFFKDCADIIFEAIIRENGKESSRASEEEPPKERQKQ